MVGLSDLTIAARTHALDVAGLVPNGAARMPDGVRTILLLAPDEPAFWPVFTQSAEYRDGAPDPMDRWSRRVITQLAKDVGAHPIFPFGATPPHPFYTWALASGRVWSSPVRFLVGQRAGLWASYRGALGLAQVLDPMPRVADPCTPCPRPCTSACPVGALTEDGYDITACHAYLDTAQGQDCMTQGCAVRRACPVSQRLGRDPDQSAFHMRQFHR
jgi:ferredoxin